MDPTYSKSQLPSLPPTLPPRFSRLSSPPPSRTDCFEVSAGEKGRKKGREAPGEESREAEEEEEGEEEKQQPPPDLLFRCLKPERATTTSDLHK